MFEQWDKCLLAVGCSENKMCVKLVCSSGTTQTMNNKESLNCFGTICWRRLVSSPYACFTMWNTLHCGSMAITLMTTYFCIPFVLMATASFSFWFNLGSVQAANLKKIVLGGHASGRSQEELRQGIHFCEAQIQQYDTSRVGIFHVVYNSVSVAVLLLQQLM